MWLKFQQILTKLQTAVTWVLDEQWRIQKKRKSSEFDAEDDGHNKLGPAVKVWSHKGFILKINVQPAPLLPVLPNEVKCQSSGGYLECI